MIKQIVYFLYIIYSQFIIWFRKIVFAEKRSNSFQSSLKMLVVELPNDHSISVLSSIHHAVTANGHIPTYRSRNSTYYNR